MIKVDLLGLGMMKALEECVVTLNSRGVDFDLAHIPPDDPKTYQMISEGRHGRRVSDREPCADGHASAHEAGALL